MNRTVSKNCASFILHNGGFLIIACFIAVVLKYHYSKASSDDLIWILGPTVGLVEQISGIRFEKEAYTGFANRTYRIIIAPSCAGVNFLIVAFCMAVFSGIHRIESKIKKLLWVTASAMNAYMLTVLANALRIILSIYCYRSAVFTTGFTPERMHRLTGILIYFFFLCIFHSILDRGFYMYSRGIAGKGQGILISISNRSENVRLACAALIPFFWYGFITLAVPFMNSAYHENGTRFIEHGWMVVCGCIVVLTIRLILRLMYRRIGDKLTTWKEKTVEP